jgi:Protein of unknown function (DUF2934)
MTKSTKATKLPRASHDAIETRSYELYLARGGADGHHEEDWLRAEAELNGG